VGAYSVRKKGISASGEDELGSFVFDLPESFVARRPVSPRSSSKLMVLDRGAKSVFHSSFESLPSYFDEGDCLVLNETRVLPCRLDGTRTATGGRLELLFVRKSGGALWEALVRPTRRLREGTSISVAGGAEVKVAERVSGATFLFEVPDDFEGYLEKWGKMPIPPYLKRPPDSEDREDYQTVYARVSGSSAAPTAGLHFSGETIRKLEARGVSVTKLVLHVGPGTFKPLIPGSLASQRLDPEYYKITAETCQVINRARGRGGRVFAVGTSTARALESAAEVGKVSVEQGNGSAVQKSAGAASGRRIAASLEPQEGWTEKFIYPPYEFRSIDALVTNFHLPASSVLLLVCAFAGREFLLSAYEEAKAKGYRFYSYGDAMLIL
jgi:S-adenosylmethionine:tRNA ribosyltransferase-isomerase